MVILAYVIGFTTAFIMFALVDKDRQHKAVHLIPEENLGRVEAMERVEIMENGEGLFVKKGGEERIISALVDALPTEPGFHTDIVVASVSPDGAYVHYCAVTEVAEECQHFIYSVREDKTYMVKAGDAMAVTPSAEVTTITWSGASDLNVSGQTASPASLWTLR